MPQSNGVAVSNRLRKINMTGMRVGSWTVLSEDPEFDRHGIKWICICDCGNTRSVFGSALRHKTDPSSSCGCIWRPKPGTAVAKLYRQYADNAKDRGLAWELSLTRFVEITSSPCYYTGRPPQQLIKARGKEEYWYNGVDRLDSRVGYVEGNVVACCKDANYAKLELSESDFLQLVKQIYEHRGLKCTD